MTLRKRDITRSKIEAAITRLLNCEPTHSELISSVRDYKISVSVVAKESGLSRESLYKNYPDIVDKLRDIKDDFNKHKKKISPNQKRLIEMRAELNALKVLNSNLLTENYKYLNAISELDVKMNNIILEKNNLIDRIVELNARSDNEIKRKVHKIAD